MGWHHSADRQAFFARRSERMAKVGAFFEMDVEEILKTMQEDGAISSFVHHAKNSFADHDGKDFTVYQWVGDIIVRRSFGVTISHRSWSEASVRHSGTPQFYFPIGTKPETIKKRIVGLFS